MSKIKVNEIDKRNGSTVTLGGPGTNIVLGTSGQSVTLGCGATQTGFGRTGTVNWCTTAKTSPFTAANGVGYFVNTSGGVVTVTLPSSPSAGDIVAINDVNGTFDTNALTLGRNSSKINGGCEDLLLTSERQSTTIIYSGAPQGWVAVNDANVGGNSLNSQYNVQYLVVAGGGGGGESYGGGGGGGGYRTVASKTFAVTSGQSIPITVGAGGAHAHPGGGAGSGCNGSNSVFSTIASAGGGGGGFGPSSSPTATDTPGKDGGSGGGGGAPPGMSYSGFGAGNTPPVSPPQGNPGAPTATAPGAGGGGGAGAAGSGYNGGNGSPFTDLGPLAPSYGTPGPAPGRYFSGGGGGYASGTGGAGGGGAAGAAGTANTGGGSGGRIPTSGDGGSGIVVIRHVTADASPSVSGGNATGTCGSDTIRVFTGDGTFIA